jgi:hypothetical protein
MTVLSQARKMSRMLFKRLLNAMQRIFVEEIKIRLEAYF